MKELSFSHFIGGINLIDSPLALLDSECLILENFLFSKEGLLVRRPKVKALSFQNNYSVLRIFPTLQDNRFLIQTYNGLSSTLYLVRIYGNSLEVLKSYDLKYALPLDIIMTHNYYILTNGLECILIPAKNVASNWIQEFPLGYLGKICVAWRGLLGFANNQWKPNRIWLCGLNLTNEANWRSLNSNAIVSYYDVGDVEKEITAVVNFKDDLYIFKRDEIWKLGIDEAGAPYLSLLFKGVGTISQNSVIIAYNVMIFLDPKGDLYYYDGLKIPRVFSEKVAPLLKDKIFVNMPQIKREIFDTKKTMENNLTLKIDQDPGGYISSNYVGDILRITTKQFTSNLDYYFIFTFQNKFDGSSQRYTGLYFGNEAFEKIGNLFLHWKIPTEGVTIKKFGDLPNNPIHRLRSLIGGNITEDSPCCGYFYFWSDNSSLSETEFWGAPNKQIILFYPYGETSCDPISPPSSIDHYLYICFFMAYQPPKKQLENNQYQYDATTIDIYAFGFNYFDWKIDYQRPYKEPILFHYLQHIFLSYADDDLYYNRNVLCFKPFAEDKWSFIRWTSNEKLKINTAINTSFGLLYGGANGDYGLLPIDNSGDETIIQKIQTKFFDMGTPYIDKQFLNTILMFRLLKEGKIQFKYFIKRRGILDTLGNVIKLDFDTPKEYEQRMISHLLPVYGESYGFSISFLIQSDDLEPAEFDFLGLKHIFVELPTMLAEKGETT